MFIMPCSFAASNRVHMISGLFVKTVPLLPGFGCQVLVISSEAQQHLTFRAILRAKLMSHKEPLLYDRTT